MSFRLAECSLPARVLCTAFLVTVGLGYLIVALEVHTMIGGLTPDAVQSGIRGDEDTAALAEFAEDFGEEMIATGGLSFGKGYPDMVQTLHTHSFAMPLLFLAVGGIFLGTDVGDRWKSALYVLAFLGIVVDLGSLWLVRFVAGGFAYLNVASGLTLSGCAALFILRSLWDLWRPRAT